MHTFCKLVPIKTIQSVLYERHHRRLKTATVFVHAEINDNRFIVFFWMRILWVSQQFLSLCHSHLLNHSLFTHHFDIHTYIRLWSPLIFLPFHQFYLWCICVRTCANIISINTNADKQWVAFVVRRMSREEKKYWILWTIKSILLNWTCQAYEISCRKCSWSQSNIFFKLFCILFASICLFMYLYYSYFSNPFSLIRSERMIEQKRNE